MVSKLQNCELKQEASTLATILLLVSSFQNCELKQETSTPLTELQQTHEFHGHEKNIYSAAPDMWSRNCSEIVTSGDTFVLSLNRASALKVEDSEQNFLLRQNLVANTARIGLESKLHPDACFDSQFCHYLHGNHNPQFINTVN